MLITTPDNIELEVIPGHSIYVNDPQEVLPGVFITWVHLPDDQRVKFMEAHAELAQAATKLQGLFTTEFAGREDTVRDY